MTGSPVAAAPSDEPECLSVGCVAGGLVAHLVESGAVPRKAAEDALHIAVAAVHGVECLLTWNGAHTTAAPGSR